MPSAAELQTRAMGGLGQLSFDPLATETALVERVRGDLDRQSGDTARQINENVFGRGLGLSTVARDLQADRERLYQDALSKARRDAFLASQQATLAALSQAANAAQAERNRQSAEGQAGADRDLRRRALGRQESIANKQLLATGVGGLGGAAIGALGRAYAPDIRDFLRSLKPGGGPAATPGTPATGLNTLTSPDVAGMFNLGGADIPSFALPDVGGGFADTGGGFEIPSADFSFNDVASDPFAGLDLTLFPTGFDMLRPEDWGYL